MARREAVSREILKSLCERPIIVPAGEGVPSVSFEKAGDAGRVSVMSYIRNGEDRSAPEMAAIERAIEEVAENAYRAIEEMGGYGAVDSETRLETTPCGAAMVAAVLPKAPENRDAEANSCDTKRG